MGRYIRWQAILALAGIGLLIGFLSVSAYTYTTEIVPDRGGRYVEGIAGNPQYINPLLAQYNDVDLDLIALIFNGLTRLDQHGTVVPDLAERWETSADGRGFTFYLRHDVHWHDDSAFTFSADDVMYTVGVLQSPDYRAIPSLSDLWRSVKAEKLDDYTVRFTLAQPFAPFLDYTTIGILPAHLWSQIPVAELPRAQLNAQPVGTGPFKLSEIMADHVTLVPFTLYHGPPPYIGELQFRFFNNYPDILTAFSQGQIDGISRILPPDLPLARKRSDLNLFFAPESDYTIVIFNQANVNVPFLKQKEVRQALAYALDRQNLIDTVAAGQGILANSVMMPESWAYNPNVFKYTLNLQKAQQLLDDAGWRATGPDGLRQKDGKLLEFILLSDDDPTRANMARAIAESWRRIGVKVSAQPVTFPGLVGQFLYPRTFDVALVPWTINGDPDPYPLWHSTQAREGGQNYSGWANRQADELMEQARSTVDQAKRTELYDRFQDIFADEVPGIPIYHPVYAYGVSQKVHDVQIGPFNQPGDRFRTIAQWYVVTRRISTMQVKK